MTMPECPQTLFITGGATGIGAQLVRDSAAAGYNVAFTYLRDRQAAMDVAAEARRLNGEVKVAAYHLDVRDSAEVETVVDEAIDAFETIDVVVLNAGITRVGLMFSMTDEDWRDVLDTNLTGAFYVCRQFLGHFIANRNGRFVHVSSVAMDGMGGQAAYCASKAGLAGLSSAIAKEYGKKGITSNTIAMGPFDGGMTDAFASSRVLNFWKEFCPAGRLGNLSEIARVVHFLGAREAGFINGALLHVTGGLNYTP